MPEHRVPLLGDAWRRHEDPERSRDPRVRAVVRELSLVSVGPAPEPVFRAELRAQLVAITPRLIAEGIAAETAMVDIVPRPVAAAAPQHADVPARRRFSPGRVLAVTASVITVFALLLGGAVVLSRRSLPGDTLYGLKRAGERFQLATDSNDTERAKDLLAFARTRTDEAGKLLARSTASAAGPGVHAAASVNSGTADQITEVLRSADSDVADASRLLSGQAVADGSAAPLTNMTAWAPDQLARLSRLESAMPDASLRAAASSSRALVTRAQTRATQLIQVVAEQPSCLTSVRPDSLGPKPCTGGSATTARPLPPTRPTSVPPTAPVGSASPLRPVTGSPVTVPVQPGAGSGSGSGTGAGSGAPVTTPTTPTPSGKPLPVPTTVPTSPRLPIPTPSLPISIGSCGATLGLGGIQIGVGTCSGIKVSLGH